VISSEGTIAANKSTEDVQVGDMVKYNHWTAIYGMLGVVKEKIPQYDVNAGSPTKGQLKYTAYEILNTKGEICIVYSPSPTGRSTIVVVSKLKKENESE